MQISAAKENIKENGGASIHQSHLFASEIKNAEMIALVSQVAWLFLGGCVSVYGLLLDEDCGVASLIQPMVVGGEDATLGSTPWMAHLYANGRFVCGGSLISHRFVLTATHCVLQYKLYVRLGEYDRRTAVDCRGRECAPPPKDYTIEKIFMHPGYTSTTYYDISLIKLRQSVEYTANIRPICILLDTILQQWMDSFREYTLTGWGTMQGGQLASVNLTQIDRNTCAWYLYRVDHTHICAGDPQRHACRYIRDRKLRLESLHWCECLHECRCLHTVDTEGSASGLVLKKI